MLYHAHYVPGSGMVTVLNDRGTPIEQFHLSEPRPEQDGDLETRLSEEGWLPSAGWTETDQGWQVPVTRDQPPA